MKAVKPLLATAAVLAAALLFGRALAPPAPVELAPTPAPTARSTTDTPPGGGVVPTLDDDIADADVERSRHSRYRVSYTLDSLIGDAAGPSARVSGVWHTEALADGRIEARLTDATTRGHHLVPRADALVRAIELVPAEHGALAAIAFSPRTEDTARRLFTALATTFWFSPGDGDTWAVEEDDLMGRALVRYTRTGDDTVERRTLRYLSLRNAPPGRAEAEAAKVEPAVTTTFVFDDEGPVSVHMKSEVAYEMGQESPRMVAISEVRFTRIGSEIVARRASTLTEAPISGHVDPGADRAQLDVTRVAGASAADLIAEVERIAALDPEHPDTQKWRADAVQRLAALVRIDPDAAAELARAAVSHADDTAAYTLLTGGLGSADSVVGAEALAGLLDPELTETLPTLARRNAIDHLMLTRAGSPTTVDTLTGELDGEHGPAAAAALGAQANTLADEEPQLAAAAVETLLGRWQTAQTTDEAVQVLRALGNSGSPAAFEALNGAVWASEPRLAEAATFGLRFLPGDAVDAALGRVLERGDKQLTAGIRAVAYRDRARWQPVLEALRTRHAAAPTVVSAIDDVLRTWSRPNAG